MQATPMSVSHKIRNWFQGESLNHGWQEGQGISEEIDRMISEMPEPLPEVAKAWIRWNEFENDVDRIDPGLRIAMDLCKYAEWCADRTLGLAVGEFEGVPQLIISFA